ncbi:MAG: hypothetical protein HC801_10130 [Nitrospira sp.]|nr:hypothetical protein [Nitrospira sp.]
MNRLEPSRLRRIGEERSSIATGHGSGNDIPINDQFEWFAAQCSARQKALCDQLGFDGGCVIRQRQRVLHKERCSGLIGRIEQSAVVSKRKEENEGESKVNDGNPGR